MDWGGNNVVCRCGWEGWDLSSWGGGKGLVF